MRRHLLDLVVLSTIATIACAYVALAQPGVRNMAIYAYVFVVGGLVMLVVVSAFGDALPRRRRSPFETALAEVPRAERPPAQVEQIERAATLGVANAYDLHRRLLPHLREIAQCRLERTGRTSSPETLGPLVGAAAAGPRRAGRPVRPGHLAERPPRPRRRS